MDLLRTSIDCTTDYNDRKAMMDNFCWSVGIYVCKGYHQSDNFTPTNQCNAESDDNKVYQRYYQWIPLVFIIQASISFIPAYLWKTAEGGLMHKICDNLDAAFGRKNWNERKEEIVNYFNSQFANRAHSKYILQYLVCKVLSIVFILVNILMLNMVIPGFWSTYSGATAALISGTSNDWSQYSYSIFPTMEKCSFRSFGPSGTLQRFDSLCLLPLNVLNQKIFVIIWMWYIVQLIVSIVNVMYWVAIYFSENLRVIILKRHSMMAVSRKQILQASNKVHLGNFFILRQIARNTNTTTFAELMSELSLGIINRDSSLTKSAC